jgi:hypothetical protein
VNSGAASEYPVSEQGRSEWAALPLAELSDDEIVPRISRLTSLVVLFLLSLGSWALIWAAVASLCRG